MDADFAKVSEHFLQFVARVTELPIIICDDTGTIVNAVVASRIGSLHPFAQRIVRGEFDEYTVTAEQELADPKTKEGCNVLIEVDGQRLGSFGIAGPIQVTRPLARIAGVVIAGWIKEERQRRLLRETSDRLGSGVQAMVQRLDDLAKQTNELGARMTAEAALAAEKVAQTDGVVRSIQELSQRSRILSLNGTLQAARAGDKGLPFAVVAKEMQELAVQAARESSGVGLTLAAVRGSIEQMRVTIGASEGVSAAQMGTMKEMHQVVEKLLAAVESLATAFDEAGRR